MEYAPIRSGHRPPPRQLLVEDCLLETMQRTPYSAISVCSLCQQSGISRRTFYLYFKDKDECLDSLIDRKFRELLLDVETEASPESTAMDRCIIFLNRFLAQRFFFNMMIRNHVIDKLFYRMVHFAQYERSCFLPVANIPFDEIDEDLRSCYISSQFTLMLRWYSHGYQTPVEEVARKFLKITALLQPK